MRWLVTAGGTAVPIDRVRVIANSFTGRTGARIAWEARRRGHRVSLLTSHPHAADEISGAAPHDLDWDVKPYRFFDDLHQLMADAIQTGNYDAVIHSAAVSDYRSAGIYAPAPEAHFNAESGCWGGDLPTVFVDRSAGKVKSDEPELWLRLVKAPKLIDLIRTEWGFRGILVKFKLEVDVSDSTLQEIAERSRTHSDANLMVANTLDGASEWAFLGPTAKGYERSARDELPVRLAEAVERLHG